MNESTSTKSEYATQISSSQLEARYLIIGAGVVGRLAICYLFCGAAIYHLTVGRALTVQQMSAHRIPFADALNVVAMVVSGSLSLALLINFRTRWTALALAAYTLVVSMVMFGPQNGDWGATRVFFMKDMAIFGALLAWSSSLFRLKA